MDYPGCIERSILCNEDLHSHADYYFKSVKRTKVEETLRDLSL